MLYDYTVLFQGESEAGTVRYFAYRVEAENHSNALAIGQKRIEQERGGFTYTPIAFSHGEDAMITVGREYVSTGKPLSRISVEG